ncbi:CobW family GTP-binding protein [Vibrio sonorensis]|uniref:CobW family GTP-binding protein n=1 Tax=Vibrio sonorensis TaxID=1004316 RepID=UPI000B00CEC9|nr:GTP-binding protein [Vibrio sonorensis]
MSPIPVTILHGFLGSGKTTLLRQVLNRAKQEENIPAVIVNDMSELDVDGVLIANTDVVSEAEGNFITISGDSISSPEGVKKIDAALSKLAKENMPPWVLIETSGSSHPLPLVQYFKTQKQFALKGVITLVDATWLNTDYQQGSQLIPKWQENLQKGKRGVENLLVEQIMFSNRVFLTKSDRLDANAIQAVAQSLHPINPYAAIMSTSWGNISTAQLTQVENYNFELVEQLSKELKDQVDAPLTLSGKAGQKIVAKVINDDRPFHPQRLWETCHSYLTEGVFRSKGFFWMPSRDDMSLLWTKPTEV